MIYVTETVTVNPIVTDALQKGTEIVKQYWRGQITYEQYLKEFDSATEEAIGALPSTVSFSELTVAGLVRACTHVARLNDGLQ